MSIRHQVESGVSFHANRDLQMDIVIEAGGLRDATVSEYRDKPVPLDVTYAKPTSGGPHAVRQRESKRVS